MEEKNAMDDEDGLTFHKSHTPTNFAPRVGEAVGLVVGEAVGLVVGEGEGGTAGEEVGEEVGDIVGEKVVLLVGDVVGLVVGESVGESVGLSVGGTIGLSVGEVVGVMVGEVVGGFDGAVVGEVVGGLLGLLVGVLVVGVVVGVDDGLAVDVREFAGSGRQLTSTDPLLTAENQTRNCPGGQPNVISLAGLWVPYQHCRAREFLRGEREGGGGEEEEFEGKEEGGYNWLLIAQWNPRALPPDQPAALSAPITSPALCWRPARRRAHAHAHEQTKLIPSEGVLRAQTGFSAREPDVAQLGYADADGSVGVHRRSLAARGSVQGAVLCPAQHHQTKRQRGAGRNHLSHR